METNEKSINASKSDYQAALRPASIRLKEKEIYVYPSTKGIINFEFPSIPEAKHKSYLNFNDFNYEWSEEVSVYIWENK